MTYNYIAFFQALTNWLADYQDRQQELISIIDELTPSNSLHDKTAPDADWSPMEVMDPFTFLTFFLRYGDRQNVAYLNALSDRVGLSIASIDALPGVPTPNPQSSWFFAYAYKRKPNDVGDLWAFFHAARRGEITDEIYQQTQNIRQVGYTKLTEGLFRLNPDIYFPINGPTKRFLEDRNIPVNITSWDDYQRSMRAIKNEFPNRSFAEISREAWVESKRKSLMERGMEDGPEMLVIKTGNEQSDFWSVFQAESMAAVSYSEMQIGDVSRFASKSEISQFADTIPGYKKGWVEILFNVATASVGSIVFAGEGRNRILGVGRITESYRYKADDQHNLFHQLPVEWFGQLDYHYEGDGHLMRINSFGRLNKYPLVLEHIRQHHPDLVRQLRAAGVPVKWFENKEEPLISTQNWLKLLGEETVFYPQDMEMIQAFYEQPDHEASAYVVDAILKGVPHDKGENIVVNKRSADLAKRVIRSLEIPETLLDQRDDGSIRYWSVLYTITPKDGKLPYQLRPELATAFAQLNRTPLKISKPLTNMNKNTPLNQILYGPPGTGKTYSSIQQAVQIANPEFLGTERENIRAEYQRLVAEGRVVFTTFHQSLSYEDFVEGLKPVLADSEEESGVQYEIKPGVFRDIVTEAIFSYVSLEEEDEENTVSFISMWNAYLAEIRDRLEEEQYVTVLTKSGREAKIVDISSQGNLHVRSAHGEKIFTISLDRQTRLHEALPELTDIEGNIYTNFREVIGGSNATLQWAVLNAIREFGSTLSSSEKTLNKHRFSKEDKRKAIRNLKPIKFNEITEPYVLIIDEINRGNVSAILGELITLLEPDKRLGRPEELTVTLPYSRDTFGVPPNLYLIGTMNTADRSVVALDSALRRRFRFIEVPPDSEVIRENLEAAVHVGDLDLDCARLMEVINERVEFLLDHDHCIGHSYFLKMKTAKDVAEQFATGVVPLLREYFYEDYRQLRLVLGDGFVGQSSRLSSANFPAGADMADYDVGDYVRYKVRDFRGNIAGLAKALRILLNQVEPDKTEV